MSHAWQALSRGESAPERRRLLERAHERFVGNRELVFDAGSRARFAQASSVRAVVLESWLRAHEHIDPDRVPGRQAFDAAQLGELRRTHPIRDALPVVRRLLLEEASESGFIVALGDAAGRLLWVDGDAHLRARAEEIGFCAGMDWSEGAVGTSAPGSALALGHGMQVLGAEHYSRAVHPWSCTAVPVRDPGSGTLIGVIDVTGGDAAASPHIMPLMEATVAAVEAELHLGVLRRRMEQERRSRAPAPRAARGSPKRRTSPRLAVLGRDPAVLELDDATLPVAGRHAEIILALALAPRGLSAEALAQRVYGEGGSPGNLRPEIARLRRWLEQQQTGIRVTSRPYRLEGGPRLDAVEALGALSRGAHRLALAAYEGPVLPGSCAPAVEELRDAVDTTLRESMLQSAAPESLFTYAHNWAIDDAQVWETLLHVLPLMSPKRARVVARLEQLAAET